MFLLLAAAAALGAPPETTVRAVYASSGDPSAALDGRLATGWTPGGDPVGESWVLVLERPDQVTRLQLQACPGQGAFDVAVWFDGVRAGRTVRVDPGLPRYVLHTAGTPVEKVEVRVESAPGQVCLAEVKASGPDGALALALTPPVHGRLASSSVQEPAFAWAPRKAFDGRLDTLYASASPTAGETLWLTLERPLEVVGIELFVGDHRDPAPQFPAGVPDRVRVSLDGAPAREFALSGALGPQLLPVSGSFERLALELGTGVGASAGLGTALTEVRLWTARGPVRVALPDAGSPGEAPIPDRLLRPVCAPTSGLPSELRLRPDGSLTLIWQGQSGGASWWSVLEGSWSRPVWEGPTWSVRVDGALETRRTVAGDDSLTPGAGPALGGTLQLTPVEGLGDGLVAAGAGADGCPDEPSGAGEVIVVWNDAAQRMR